MAVTGYLYDNFPLNLMKKNISDMSAGESIIKVALLTSSYQPAQTTDSSWSDVSALEASGTGYSAGGAALSNKAVSVSSHIATFDADDIQWPNCTITARYAVIYDDTPSGAANKKLVGYIDFGVDMTCAANTFQIVFNSSGILTWEVS
jgi:hypothetical protein